MTEDLAESLQNSWFGGSIQTIFRWDMGMSPPQKVVFLGPKLSLKNVTFVIYGPDSDGVFMRVNSTFPVSRVYP